MNEQEAIAEKYLQSLGFENIKYEPLGTTTFPDFAINENIGVEVRVLNRNHIGDTEVEADNLASKYKKRIDKILDSFQPDGTTLFIKFNVKSSHGVIDEHRLFDGLKEYLQTCNTAIYQHNLNNNLEFIFTPCTPDATKKFKYHGIQVPWVWPQEQYLKDIQFCIDDKQSKKEKQQEKLSSYKEFWLVLVDYLLQYDLSEYDFSLLNLRDFSKVIVLDTNAKEQKIMWSKDK